MTDALTQDALDQIRARLCIGFLIPDSMAVAVSVMKQMEADIRLLLAEVDRLRSELDREDASHTRTIIERDEAQDAMQRLDVLTGGDGEYRASTIDPEAPATPALMANGIAERYATLEADRDAAVARAEKAEAVLMAYQQWEADIILDRDCWLREGMTVDRHHYDRMIEIQTMRNEALGAFK